MYRAELRSFEIDCDVRQMGMLREMLERDKAVLDTRQHTVMCTCQWKPADACDALASFLLADSVHDLTDTGTPANEVQLYSHGMDYIENVR